MKSLLRSLALRDTESFSQEGFCRWRFAPGSRRDKMCGLQAGKGSVSASLQRETCLYPDVPQTSVEPGGKAL